MKQPYLLADLNLSIEMPRFHYQWKPDTLYMEQDRSNKGMRNILLKNGYTLGYKSYMDYAQGILVDHKSKILTGWSDPRSDGKAAGY